MQDKLSHATFAHRIAEDGQIIPAVIRDFSTLRVPSDYQIALNKPVGGAGQAAFASIWDKGGRRRGLIPECLVRGGDLRQPRLIEPGFWFMSG